MASRANWKGYLRLSLVSCPIALYPASSLSEKVSFTRINRKTGNRLKQQNVDSGTGEVVSRDDIDLNALYVLIFNDHVLALGDLIAAHREHSHDRYSSIRSKA